ncbi:MAG: PfkB family carbohydrate kinase, partial [Pseudomonadota bacterium]
GFDLAPGGGFNAMVAARRAGMIVAYGGSLGTGPFASMVIDGLRDERIALLRSRDLERDQGCCTVMIDADGERTFVASDGSEGHVERAALDEITFSEYDWTLLSGYALHYPGSRDTLTDWLERNGAIRRFVFDPSPLVAKLERRALAAALARATWVSANLREAAVITGLSDPKAAALALAVGREGGAVVRNGAAGCVVATGNRSTEIPGIRVNAIDTTGAGDTHVGTFIAELERHGDPIGAARYANAAAAISTTFQGPATAPSRGSVNKFLNTKKVG